MSSSSKTYFSDSDATPTPFNAFVKKNGKRGYNEEMVAAADTIQGLSQKNARMWQIIALVSLLSFFISLGILLYAVKLPKTVPVIVTVDNNGNATYVGKVDSSYWGKSNIPEHHKTAQVLKLIQNMYTWSTDKAAQNIFQKECENICQGTAINQLDSFFIENNPYEWTGIKTQSVQIDPPLKQTSNTYVVYYNVTTYNRGNLEYVKRYSALITLDYFELTENTKNLNPLGVYITSFDIQPIAN